MHLNEQQANNICYHFGDIVDFEFVNNVCKNIGILLNIFNLMWSMFYCCLRW